MKFLFCLVAIFTVAASSVISTNKQSNLRKSGGISPTLTALGEVDGKIYYVDFEYMPWQSALGYCRRLGDNFDLGSITTRAQMDFLIQAFNETGYSEDFWTSGRDAHGARQYTWDHSGEQVTSVINFAASPWFQTCLVVRPTPGNGTKVHGVHCENNNLAVLCEDYCGIDC